MSGPRAEQAPKLGNQVVHVREGSDVAMQQLFEIGLDPQKGETLNPIPFSKRNLPPSFFKPPDPRGHSREGSADSTHFTAGGLPISHIRAHSSPATLQASLSAAPPNPPSHMRTQSYDIVDDMPLPPGWEIAKTNTGQKYFLNHVERITTWEDPRIKSLSQSNVSQTSTGRPDIGPLPPGWEQAVTAAGEVYFINHVDRSTSWHDPRLQRMHQLQQQQQPPAQQQQQQHAVLQQSQQRAATLPSMSAAERHRQLQLQQLHLEKEKLKQRQEELARQYLDLQRKEGTPQVQCNMLQEQMVRSSLDEPMQQQAQPQQMPNATTSSVDPFLGQDFHTRQESADSGLGGMGTNYSLPRTPEGFLTNVDEMDAIAGGGKMQQDFNAMDLGGMDNETGGNMDSDDLVPSLQEDISNELLNDMETVLNTDKMENVLTWL